jgi:hypothetical protein
VDLQKQGDVDQVQAFLAQLQNLPIGDVPFGNFARNFIGDYLLDAQALGRPVFDMPLLRTPQSAFRLLLGQDVDLFVFGPPLIQGTIEAKLPFQIGPISVFLGGTIDYRQQLHRL